MKSIAFNNELMDTARGFFSAEPIKKVANVQTITERTPLTVVYSADRDTAEFIKNLPEGTLVLANADDFALMRLLGNTKSTIISCGLSGRDTITASSMEQTPDGISFELCIQREIKNLDGRVLEPQEFMVSIHGADLDINAAMLLSSAALFCGAKPEWLKDIKM